MNGSGRPIKSYMISNFQRVLNVVCFFLGNSPASEFDMPTFQNTPLNLHRQVGLTSYPPAYEDGIECSETSAHEIQTPANYPEESIEPYISSLNITSFQNKITSHQSRQFTPHQYTSLPNKITSHKSHQFTPYHCTSHHFTSKQNHFT